MANIRKKETLRIYIGKYGKVLKTGEVQLKNKIEPIDKPGTIELSKEELEQVARRVAEMLGDKLEFKGVKSNQSQDKIIRRKRRMIDPGVTQLKPEQIDGSISVEETKTDIDIDEAIEAMKDDDGND